MENIARRKSSQREKRRDSAGTASETSRPPRTRPRGNSLTWMMNKLLPKRNNAQNDPATKAETEVQKEICELNDFAECSSANSSTTDDDCVEMARKLSSAAALSQMGGHNQPTNESAVKRKNRKSKVSKVRKQKRKRLFQFKQQSDLDEMQPVKNENSQEEVDELAQLASDLSSSYNRRAFLATYTDVSNDRSELQECYKRGLLRRPKADEIPHQPEDVENESKSLDVTRNDCMKNEI